MVGATSEDKLRTGVSYKRGGPAAQIPQHIRETSWGLGYRCEAESDMDLSPGKTGGLEKKKASHGEQWRRNVPLWHEFLQM